MLRLIKRIRGRFGISAPKMMVRTHVAWYWRWLGMVAALAVSLVVAAWLYDAGRRFAGFDRSETEQELSQLRASVAKLEEETRRLRSIADASESRLKIEQSAQAQLGAQVKSLEEQNTRLKEDLAFFENLTPAVDRLSIHRFKVEPNALPGEYRYRLLVLQGGRRDREFQGSLQLVVSLQQDGRNGMIVVPDQVSATDSAYKLAFKYFQRIEGTFRVPPRARVLSVQARVLERGSDQARASQSFSLS
jgi:septal ring factor EnvC (AmiA/AmiB activator)